jgi:hypothetical protein
VTRMWRQVMLSLVALGCAVLLAVVLVNEGRAEARPTLSAAPADWLLASEIADGALDSDSPRRIELWKAAHAHAKLLAPHRQNTDAAFVRAGLFHWFELGAGDRALVLQAAEPLMRDPTFFYRMHMPLLQLTGDFAWIHAHAPATPGARESLRELAVSRGLFGEYRLLREEIRAGRLQTFAARRRLDEPNTLMDLLPAHPDVTYEPLVRGILEELDRQAFDPAQISGRVEDVIDYAVRHDVRPLTGVVTLLEPPSHLREVTRARAALELNQPQLASRLELTAAAGHDPEWQPYYLERARFEATHSDAAAANTYLVRAAANGLTVPVLAAAVDVSRALGKLADEQRYSAQLASTPRTWEGLCGSNEVCTTASTYEWASERRMQRITLSNTQSDEIPPYVEIYVDDARVAEGEVRDTRTFEVPLAQGVHAIEVRLVNQRTRNGAQRRVRL